METLGNQIMPQNLEKYYCKYCDYRTSKKSSFNNHSLSTKHIKSIKLHALETFGNEIMPKLCSEKFTCEKCNKEFKNRSGLWKHNKKCLEKEEKTDKDDTNIVQHENSITPELVIEIIKQNQELQKQNNELQKQMLEVITPFLISNAHFEMRFINNSS
jgi:hypothetical protein